MKSLSFHLPRLIFYTHFADNFRKLYTMLLSYNFLPRHLLLSYNLPSYFSIGILKNSTIFNKYFIFSPGFTLETAKNVQKNLK